MTLGADQQATAFESITQRVYQIHAGSVVVAVTAIQSLGGRWNFMGDELHGIGFHPFIEAVF